MKKLILVVAIATFFFSKLHSQTEGVSISSTGGSPDPSAILDLNSSTKGTLITRMTTSERNAISNPANGLQIYNTTTGCLNIWTGSSWKQICGDCDFNSPVAGNNGPICSGSTLNLTATSIPGAVYQWSGPNGFISSQQNPSIPNATNAASGSYSVTATLNGCTSQPQSTVATVNSTPEPPSAGNNGPLCVGATLNLTSSAIIGATYSWTGPNGYNTNTQNPSIPNAQVNTSGTYSVTATLNGCTSPAQSTVATINAIPDAPTGGNNGPLCLGGTLNLTTPSVQGASYNWSGPNGYTSNAQNPTISNVQNSNAGAYYVSVTVNGCTSLEGQTIFMLNATPLSTFTPLTASATIGRTFYPTETGATYSWTFSGGSPSSSSAENPVVTWSSAGSYSVSLTVTSNGCSSSTTSTVVVANPTVQTFNATGTGKNGSIQTFTVPSTGTYTIDAIGAGAVKAQWNLGAGFSSVTPGYGARMKGDFVLTAGTQLNIVVGQQGLTGSQSSSGGGGTFVYTGTNNMLIVAGGGGGCGLRQNGAGGNGTTATDGTTMSGSTSAGTNGSGGGSSSVDYTGGGGAGYNGNGANATGPYSGTGGQTYSSSWIGGSGASTNGWGADGGFGGGGAAGAEGGGGGGGYSGGSGGIGCIYCNSGGGGGGSYNSGTNQSNTAGYQNGHGQVTITY